MPSLSELQEFKASFHDIGGQKADLETRKIPFDDLELPDHEPEPLPTPAEENATGEDSAPDFTEAEPALDPADGIDFSAFLGSQPDDLPEPPPAAMAEDEMAQTPENLNPPEELLSNLSEELDAIPPDFPDESPPADSGPADGFADDLAGGTNLDLDSLDNFDLPDEPLPTNDGLAGGTNLDNNLPAESFSADSSPAGADPFDLSVFDDLNVPDEPAPAGESENPDIDNMGLPEEVTSADEGETLDTDNMDNLGLPEEAAPADEGGDLDIDNLADFGLPEEVTPADESEIPDTDNMDNLGLPEEAAPADEGGDLDIDNLADFGLPEEAAPADDGETLDVDNMDNLGLPEETAPADDGGDLDIDNLADFGLPEEAVPAGEGETLDVDNMDNLGLPEEAAPADDGGDLDIDNLADFGLPEEAAPADEGGDLDIDNLADFGLPEEAAPAGEGENLDTDNMADLGLPEEAAPADEGGDLDLDNLADFGLPEEAAPAGEGETLDTDNMADLGLPEEAAPADDGGDLDLDNLADFGLPEEAAPAGEGETLDVDNMADLGLPEEAAPADEGGDLDIDNLADFGLPEEAAPTDDGGNLDLDNLGDLGSSEEAAPADEGGDLDIDNLADFGLPEEAAPTDDGGNLDLDNLGDLGSSDEAAPADDGGNLDLDNLGDLGSSDEAAPADATETSDLGNLDDLGFSDEAALADDGGTLPDESIVIESDGIPDSGGIDDFSFPELDNVLKRSQQKTTDTGQKTAKKRKRRGKAQKVKTEALPDDVEEIQLSDDEFEGLQETLARYPLNLRIACEEIIAEQAVNPKQMSELIEHLVWGATAKETAVLAGRILGKTITVPKGFEKSTGAALEAEQASFAYIFVHNFLPVLRLFMFIAIAAASLFYLVYNFIYIPLKAEEIYKIGYERIFAGEYQRANQRFSEAFAIHRKKDWFYKYAEAFRDERQYIYAEEKYEELLHYYLRDKKGILDYANLETYYLRNYAKADSLLRTQLLDYAPNDPEGLLAAGDNCLMWGEVDYSKYEDARYYYARLLEKYGWKAPVVERMMKYFIRTDNLKEVLILKDWFDNNPKWQLSAESLGELGGYLLDKQLEEVRGVPNEYVEYIDDVRDLLLRAVYADPSLPEPHYHLARYYHHLGNTHEERVTLRIAVKTFDEAPEISIRRVKYHIDAIQRYADVLINDREFMPAEEQLVKGINLYEDAVARRLISHSPQYGRLYAGMGDLEYFTKTGDMGAALGYYKDAERNGWAPPEMQYRMGSAYYQLEDWKNAMEYLFAASSNLPLNRRILFALGNAAFKRGNYFAAQGYYNRLLDILENQRSRLPVLLPNDRPEYLELAERLMMARNNAGVASEMLAAQTGNRSYQTRAISYYAESSRAWDSLTRDPRTMIRSGSTPLPYLNTRNALHPQAGYEPQIFIRIDREALENSPWEDLSPLLRMEHGKSN